ncbi:MULTISPECIES: cyclic nucleotide-binding domain-containing protein [unclassified Chelatococcus]|uniref:cyclic nucleotide-binding domain-containing protein n=1 Tax=unclassified Chelatococcus TaxID=2638111 RepID=UPI001BCC131B|nr:MULTISPECIES: cyclic nucleotide-binding domain-containing protein [unclassified Chelatococcus]CAH1657435.1 cAMP-binding proteins - catabolite gene activator and regulatory subunit of cAMP-dependent protein kinases [Hyphomicrobiales bacterium]MBS7740681.1 cyclic nucleotide-binding domain-containing protein [Chelatococcus sp. HY11]MBX3546085.1 cyclic nucleotide-binding domain-containing protein [Chelatococcus sp.]MCO5079834.1 cyclic nucleotide-binding domain-containing protein [Chelatococcus s
MGLNDDLETLSRVPLLSLIEPEALRLLAFAAETRILRAGDILFRRGENADGGYIVVSGAIALDARDDGSPANYIARPGTLLGESALFAECSRPATAIAREPSSVMKMQRGLVHRVLGEFPHSARALHDAIAARLIAFSQELGEIRDTIDATSAEPAIQASRDQGSEDQAARDQA